MVIKEQKLTGSERIRVYHGLAQHCQAFTIYINSKISGIQTIIVFDTLFNYNWAGKTRTTGLN